MTHAPLSQSCPTDVSVSVRGASVEGPCPSSASTSTSLLRQSRADHLVALIAGQLANQQAQLDSCFANHVIITYELNDLAVQFGTPIRTLLRACTKAMIAARIPPTCSITSDHTLRCLLRPTRQGTVPERGLSPEPDSHA